MTNYIEEMMKTANVEKQYYSFKSADGNTYTWELNEDGNEKHNMCFIGKPELKQRDFTAEKQLEIIKLIAHNTDSNSFPLIIYFNKYNKNYYLFYQTPFDEDKGDTEKNTNNLDFAQALAQLMTELMKAGELDKEKVKEILER